MPSSLKPPFFIALLTLPYGIAVGWGSVSLPTGLILHGFAPVQAGLLIAPALSLYLWRILPGVLVDQTLSFRFWMRFGMALTVLGVLPFLWWPLVPGRDGGMAWVIAVSQAGAMLLLLGATGYLLRGTSEHTWGRAAGWFHFGILAGLWLSLFGANAMGKGMSGSVVFAAQIVLIAVCLLFTIRIPSLSPAGKEPIAEAFRGVLSDGKAWFSSRQGIWVTLMSLCPIGLGAAAVGWKAGFELHAVPMVEYPFLVGPLTLGCTGAGYLAGGYMADRFGPKHTWLWLGAGQACMAIFLAVCPPIPWLFIAGMMVYVFLSGCCKTAFWAILAESVGPRLAVVKFTALVMITEFVNRHMQSLDGWLCDEFSFGHMLIGEALLALICLGVAVLLKRRWGIADKSERLDY